MSRLLTYLAIDSRNNKTIVTGIDIYEIFLQLQEKLKADGIDDGYHHEDPKSTVGCYIFIYWNNATGIGPSFDIIPLNNSNIHFIST